ncbi:MAG TPA: hypothetical protein VLX91_14420 [Candidatus Acidoferrales bacterium]|nr:hypothetical protein [Candidatus Acidoferrales bacterium]
MKSVGLFFLIFLAAGCSPLALKPADFSWPIESELKVNSRGMVQEDRYSISFNVKPLFYEETKDSSDVANHTIRLIRDERGFYFITAAHFKNVYVFSQNDGSLSLEKAIAVSKDGLSSPAFNQRAPYIELLSGKDRPIMLTKDGIQEEAKK